MDLIMVTFAFLSWSVLLHLTTDNLDSAVKENTIRQR